MYINYIIDGIDPVCKDAVLYKRYVTYPNAMLISFSTKSPRKRTISKFQKRQTKMLTI